MQNCIDFVYSGQDSAKNLWGKHRDSMRRPEIDGRQAFCLKRKKPVQRKPADGLSSNS